MKQLNFLHLVYLRALIEERSVTRAAEHMGIGQPAMSSALSKLRLIFSDPLLTSTRNGMEPTPRALELMRLSMQISALVEGRGVSQQAFVASESSVHWKVMASDAIARALLPSLMERIGTQAPKMRLTVQPGDPRKLQDSLRDGEFDLAVTFARNPASELRQVALYPQKLVGIARKDHPHIQGKVTLKQFLQQAHVRWGTPPASYTTLEAMVDEKLAQLGHSRQVNLMVSSMSILPEVVAKSNLIAVIPERVAYKASRELTVQVFPLPFKVPQVEVSLIWHERLHHDPAHKWFRKCILDISRQDVIPEQRSSST